MLEIIWDAGLLGSLTKALSRCDDNKSLQIIKELAFNLAKISNYFSLEDYLTKIIELFA